MQTLREYTVVGARPADAPPNASTETDAPSEILERFEGRTFTLHELEQRGVRIGGGQAVFAIAGRDWFLDLFPHVGAD